MAVKTLMGLVLISFLFVPMAGAAQGAADTAQPAASTPFKIAVVNRKEVFDNYNKQKEEWKSLEAEKQDLQKQIDKLSDGITADKERLEKGTGMTEDQKSALRDKIESDYRTYQTEFKRLQGEIDSKSRKFFARMMEEIDKAITEIGTAENYHLILEADPKSPTSVLYYSDTINITSKVIAHLNGGASK